MNGWIDVAAVLVAGTIATILIIKEVGWKRRYQELEVHLSLAQKERDALKSQVDTLSKDNLMLIDRMHGIEAERDANKLQSETSLFQLEQLATSLCTCMQERDKLTKHVDAVTRERDEAIHMFNTLQTKLDGMAIAIRDQAQRNASVVAERDGLRAQNQRTLGDNTALIDGMHEQEVQIHELRAQLADGHAAPRKRASRTKPTPQE